MQVLAQPAAAIQIAEHAFRQHAQRVVVLRPLQLLPAITQMFEHVAQPQQIRALLTHDHHPSWAMRWERVWEKQRPCHGPEDFLAKAQAVNPSEDIDASAKLGLFRLCKCFHGPMPRRCKKIVTWGASAAKGLRMERLCQCGATLRVALFTAQRGAMLRIAFSRRGASCHNIAQGSPTTLYSTPSSWKRNA